MDDRLYLVGVLFFGIFLHSLFLDSHFDRDEGFILTVGWGVNEGKVLYKDFFEFKPPAGHYTAALVYPVFGHNLTYYRLFILAVNLGSAIIIYNIGRLLWSAKTGLIASFLFLLGVPLFEGNKFFSEVFIVFFSGLGLFYYLRYLDSERKSHIFYAGFFYGMAVLYKQVALLLLVGVVIHLLVSKKRLHPIILFSLGAILPAVFFTIYFIKAGALGIAFESLVSIFGRYKPNTLAEFLLYLRRDFIAIPLLWILIISSFLPLARKKFSFKIDGAVYMQFILTLPPILFKQFPHYYIPAIAFGSLLAGKSLIELTGVYYQFLGRFWGRLLFVSVVFILLAPSFARLHEDYLIQKESKPLENYVLASKFIRENTSPGDKILVIAKEAQIHFLSERFAPTKYYFIDYSTHYPGIEEYLISESEKSGVKYYIAFENPYLKEYTGVVYEHILENAVLVKEYPQRYAIKIYARKSS